MRTIKISLAAIMLSILTYSCAKDGATGPQGPPGPSGAANIYMADYVINPVNWTGSGNSWYYVTGVEIPTTDVVNVYVSLDGNGYTPLSTSSFFYSGDVLTYVYGNGANLTIWEYFSSQLPNATLFVKVADIPPAIYVKHPGTNWSNYNEVAALPEVKLANSNKQ